MFTPGQSAGTDSTLVGEFEQATSDHPTRSDSREEKRLLQKVPNSEQKEVNPRVGFSVGRGHPEL
jgi:hypothetical protein